MTIGENFKNKIGLAIAAGKIFSLGVTAVGKITMDTEMDITMDHVKEMDTDTDIEVRNHLDVIHPNPSAQPCLF